MKSNSKIREMTFIALFVAIISIVSQIAIPMPSTVPMTIQLLVIVFFGYFLGVRQGMIGIFLYIAIGAVGAPVFAGFRGGFYVLLGPTGGFIWGFILVVLLCAIAAKTRLAIVVGMISIMLCHFIGVIQFSFVAGIDMWVSFVAVSLPYIIKDIAFVPLAYLLYKKMSRLIKI